MEIKCILMGLVDDVDGNDDGLFFFWAERFHLNGWRKKKRMYVIKVNEELKRQ